MTHLDFKTGTIFEEKDSTGTRTFKVLSKRVRNDSYGTIRIVRLHWDRQGFYKEEKKENVESIVEKLWFDSAYSNRHLKIIKK